MDPTQRRPANGQAPSVAELFAAAQRFQQEGRLREAHELCRQILALTPRHADTLHLFGVLALQVGRTDAALPLIRDAVAINPRIAHYHFSHGHALHASGQTEAAIASFRQAIRLRPDFADAHSALGAMLGELNRWDEALVSHRKAVVLRADHADAHNNLANTLAALRRWNEAIAAYQKAIALRPAYPEAYANLAATWSEIGEHTEAASAWRAAVALRPDDPDLLNGLGNALRETGALDDAAHHHRRALAVRPDDTAAHNDLGNALAELEHWDDAVASYQEALRLRPSSWQALNNLGNARLHQDRPADAEACFREALALRPDFVQAHHNLAILCREQGRLDEADAAFRAALAIEPDYIDSRYGQATLRLSQGAFDEGWTAFEWRWQTPILRRTTRPVSQPQWQGEPAAGRRLLIHAEHGFGNTLQFCRLAPLAEAAGLEVTLEVQPALVRLVSSLSGTIRVIPAGSPRPPFDLHCPMLSLPRALGLTLDTIPADIPYLHADPDQIAAWRTRLADAPGLLVGLAWAGAPQGPLPGAIRIDRKRSLAPHRLAPLLAVPNIRFISLQTSGPAPDDLPIQDVSADLSDFADTAALVATLDLVISVDTAAVHLAGALGRPVWLLDRFDPCWRWLRDRTDSPWYPTLRIHRQPHPNDWDPVLAAVARDLSALAAA